MEKITNPVLIDTGPLVAIFNANDKYHEACIERASSIVGQKYTTWPVLTETSHLLRRFPGAFQKLLKLISSGEIRLLTIDPGATEWLIEFSSKIPGYEFQIADATLIYLAERHEIESVFSLDKRDFSVYAQATGNSLLLLPESIEK